MPSRAVLGALSCAVALGFTAVAAVPAASTTPAPTVHLLDTGADGSVITDVTPISEMNGWTPNIRAAIDRRGSSELLTGAGVDIALIDSGITPVPGLDGSDKVINGPDLSTDPASVALDAYGHGTHLAGIIAGNDGDSTDGSDTFTGIAPDARLVNVRVADSVGATSIPQVVAAIEWVIVNKQTDGLNVRVLTLALGYDGPDYMADPIVAAIEEAWAQGIVVVVAAGNKGPGSNGLDNPAVDPFAIAVAATDQHDPNDRKDDTIATWSSSGDGVRNPDVAAPGRSIVSLRVPGSHADLTYPESRIGTRFAVASGTSQSTAVMAGSVALLLEKDPTLTPDQVKNLFELGARDVVDGENLDGSGHIQLDKTLSKLNDGLKGEPIQQFHTRVFAPEGFATGDSELAGAGWSGAGWSGAGWSGAGWSGAGWSGAGWSGAGWSGAGWSGAGWS